MSSMLPTVKLSDHQKLRSFLQSEKAATLAVPIDDAGTVHAASLLYVHDENPLRLYFITGKSTEKYTLLRSQNSIPAAIVIGTEKGTPFTVQLRGSVQAVDPTTYATIVDRYYQKRGNRGDDIADKTNGLLVFIPQWARFTDYAKGYDQYMLALS